MTTTRSIHAIAIELNAIADEFINDGMQPDGSGGGQSAPVYMHPAVESHLRRIAKEIVALNPRMLSLDWTMSQLSNITMTGLVNARVIGDCFDIYEHSAPSIPPEEFAERWVRRLRSFDKTERLQEFVLHFPIDRGTVFEWCGVTFREIDHPNEVGHDGTVDWLLKALNGRVTALADAGCPGDVTKQYESLSEQVNGAMRRAVGAAWPKIMRSDRLFSIPSAVGAGPDPSFVPIRVFGQTWWSTRVALAHPPLRFPSGLDDLWNDALPRLTQVLATPSTGMERRVSDGLLWLGEAAAQDLLAMRFVRVATALEALVGDEGRSAQTTHAGVTALIRERAAYLAGTDPADRKDIHDRVGRYYEQRSNILHGTGDELDLDDVIEFGRIVWRVAHGLVAHLDELTTPADFNAWITTRRYGDR